MTTDIAISVQNLSKCYQIYDNPGDRLKQFIVPRIKRLLGQTHTPYYREFWALKDISFEVKRGETVGIIGRNGSGKSTLLQIICGTLTPTGGTVQTNGRIAALLELGSGFNPEFTGRENVYLNAAVLGLSKEEVDARFDQITAFADIGQFIEQPVKTYSSGMMLRLAFAVIAHVDADILIVDEALSVGDAFFNQKCMRFLRNFMKTGTILFVSHDTGAVVNLCSDAILLGGGQVIASGTTKQVTEAYLATLFESSNNADEILVDVSNKPVEPSENPVEYRDVRETLINSSTLRNDIEIFQFKSDQSEFGTGAAKIISVQLLNPTGTPLSWIVGGEDVILDIRCLAIKDILRPIIGFQFKDRLGQVIFSDNTYLTYQHSPFAVDAGAEVVARFEFRLPVLPTGDYSFSAAIAEGTQDEHVQHHWLHDALLIKVHASSTSLGLVGIPMKSINLNIESIKQNE